MPELSRFYGIVVQVYYRDHPPAHFHVEYAGAIAKIDPLPGALRFLALFFERFATRY